MKKKTKKVVKAKKVVIKLPKSLPSFIVMDNIGNIYSQERSEKHALETAKRAVMDESVIFYIGKIKIESRVTPISPKVKVDKI